MSEPESRLAYNNIFRLNTDEESELACTHLAVAYRRAYETISTVIRAEDIFVPAYRHIFEICAETYNNTDAADAIAEVMLKTKKDERLRAAAVDVIAEYAHSSKAKRYAMQVREGAMRRSLHQMCYDMMLKYPGADTDPFEMLSFMQTSLEKLSPFDVPKRSDMTEKLSEHWERSTASAEEKLARLTPTGINALDKILDGGFEAGDLVIIGARSSVGKTALGVSMMLNAIRRGYITGFLTLEMPEFQIIRRLTTQMSGIPMSILKSATLTEWEMQNLLAAQVEISTLNDEGKIYIADGAATLLKTRAELQRFARANCKMIFIDYLQLIRAEGGNKSRNREQEIAEVSRALKSLAKEYNLIIVAMAQLNKEAEGKAPMMAAVRESESIIQDADYVMLLDRPEVRNEDKTHFNGVEVSTLNKGFLYLRKARNGATGNVILEYTKDIAKFSDLPTELPI